MDNQNKVSFTHLVASELLCDELARAVAGLEEVHSKVPVIVKALEEVTLALHEAVEQRKLIETLLDLHDADIIASELDEG
jgi:hypothetical protein